MNTENTLQNLVTIFKKLTQIESSYAETNLSESYFLKSVNTELREIIMVSYLNSDLLTVGQYIKEERKEEYYALVYAKISDMKKNIDKNLKVIQSVSGYIKDRDARQHIKNTIHQTDVLLRSIAEFMGTFASAKNHMH
jgi:hypothetical protein